MGIDDFDGMLRRPWWFPPHMLEGPKWEEVTNAQRDMQYRLMETLEYGVEEVDINEIFAGRPHHEITPILLSTQIISLSSFCRGNCPECGRSSKPYSPQNRKIFALEPLKEFFLNNHIAPVSSEIFIYDADDPAGYPYILELAHYLEIHGKHRQITLLSSCPPGSEEVFLELLRQNMERVNVCLSVLPSNRERLYENGVLQAAANAQRIKNVEPLAVGRGRRGVNPDRLAVGFSTSETVILSPGESPYYYEHHLASELYPDEGKLVKVDDARKVPLPNPFRIIRPKDFFDSSALICTPYSGYQSLDTGEITTEISYRHLAVYLYTILENITERRSYNHAIPKDFKIIMKAVEEGKFLIPEDEKETEFYRQLIPKLLAALERAAGEANDPNYVPLSGRIVFGAPEQYEELIQVIKTSLAECTKCKELF